MRRIRPAGQTSFTGSPADVGISAVEAAAGGNPFAALAATAAYQAGTTPTDAQWSGTPASTGGSTPSPGSGGGGLMATTAPVDLRTYAPPTDWTTILGVGALAVGAGILTITVVRRGRRQQSPRRVRRRRFA